MCVCVNKVLEKAIYRKVMPVKGVRHKSQWIKSWKEQPMANTKSAKRAQTAMEMTALRCGDVGGGLKFDEVEIRAKEV